MSDAVPPELSLAAALVDGDQHDAIMTLIRVHSHAVARAAEGTSSADWWARLAELARDETRRRGAPNLADGMADIAAVRLGGDA